MGCGVNRIIGNLILDNIPIRPYVDRVPFTAGRLRRRARGGAGCGVLRARFVTGLPGGSGNPPSATTSGRHKRVHARLRRAMELADGEARLLHPARTRSQQSSRWSAERRAFPVERKAPAGACGRTSFARRRVPLHPSVCRRSAPPHLCGEGKSQTSEEFMPSRERSRLHASPFDSSSRDLAEAAHCPAPAVAARTRSRLHFLVSTTGSRPYRLADAHRHQRSESETA